MQGERTALGGVRSGWLAVLTVALAGFVAALSWQSAAWAGSPQPAPRSVLIAYWLLFAGLWATLTFGLWRFGPGWQRAGPIGRSVVTLLGLATVARLLMLGLAEPVLSDDIWRYLHEGALLAGGENPYARVPANIAPNESPLPSALAKVNHPELGAVYQPTAQYVFACLTWLHHGVLSVLGDGAWPRATTFRLGMTVVELGLITLLIVRLREAGRSPWWVSLYALHPLAISEVAGSGHQDVLGITALVGALILFDRPQRRWLFPVGGGIALALAVAVKPIAAPAAIPVAWALRRWWAGLGLTALSGAATMALLYTPFVVMPGGIETMVESVRAFADRWTFNGSMYPLIKDTVDPVGYDLWWRVNNWLAWIDGALPGAPLTFLLADFVKMVGEDLSRYLLAGAALLAMGLSLWRSNEKLYRPVVVYLLVMMLGTSTLHPWYVLWALALMPLAFDAAVWTLSGTIMLSYVAMLHPQTNYAVPVWIKLIEFMPVYALAILGWCTGWGVTRPGWLRPLPLMNVMGERIDGDH
jgi:hypothetical protein